MAVCEHCGTVLTAEEAVTVTPAGKIESLTLCRNCAQSVDPSLRPKLGIGNMLGALVVGAVFAAVAAFLWYEISITLEATYVLVSFGVGALTAAGVYLGSGKKRGYAQSIISGVLTTAAMAFAFYLLARHLVLVSLHLKHGRLFVSMPTMLRLIKLLVKEESSLVGDWFAAVLIGAVVVSPYRKATSGVKVNPMLATKNEQPASAPVEDEGEEVSESGDGPEILPNYAKVDRPGVQAGGDFHYRVMGRIAKMSSDMRRYRVNGVPFNYWLMVILGFAVYFCAQVFIEALTLRSSGYPPAFLALAIPAVFGALLLVTMLVAAVKSYVIYRSSPAAEDMFGVHTGASIDDKQINMHITGTMHLSPKVSRRFLDVPTGLDKLDSGERVFFSNIDASSTTYGVKTNDMSGIWALAIQPNTLTLDSQGLLYLGKYAHPAMKLSFVDLQTNKPVTTLLTFANEAERSRVRGLLML